jgi:MFS family permease
VKLFSLPRAAVWLGWASLISDVASEAVYPILPLFLTSTLGASLIFVGTLEGSVEAISSLVKLLSGIYSDRLSSRQPFVFFGYLISNGLRPLIGFSTYPFHVLTLRIGDRIGKGIRTAPRDAWLAGLATPETRGKIFGFHRGMDNAGATIAPLLTTAFLYFYPGDYRTLFLLTTAPGMLALACVWKASHAAPKPQQLPAPKREVIRWSDIRDLPKNFKIFLAIVFLFTLSLSTDAFLILRLREAGLAITTITLIWAAHNAVRMLSSFYFGSFSDRIGHRRAIWFAWIFYATIYLLFGATSNTHIMIALLLIYGCYYGMSETAEKALVVEMVESRFHGTALGLFHLIVGLGSIPAGILFGGLWKIYGASTAFLISAIISILATLLFSILVLKAGPKPAHESR